MNIVIRGNDPGKSSCSIVGLDSNGAVVMRRRMRRDGVIAFAAKLRPGIMAMEACCGDHHVGRALVELGHDIRLMSPEYVRPCVKARKNDDRDAEAIAEAAGRPTIRFVAVERAEQRDVQTLHRPRDQPCRPGQERHGCWSLAARASRPGALECRSRGLGCEDGPHCLGASAPWSDRQSVSPREELKNTRPVRTNSGATNCEW